MAVSSDAPSLDIVYKLVEYAGRGSLEWSTGKHPVAEAVYSQVAVHADPAGAEAGVPPGV
jgi:nicotinate phosphoribosyltransferase